MASYPFQEIETKWQKYWKEEGTFRHVSPEISTDPKYYVLDMFPYPSGAGLHVGHPLGYIATDILAKYYKLKGYNVLHPMGFDSFGLPAENYAIETGTHPSITTEKNIQRYKEQLEMLGLGYDDKAEIRTSDPSYYKWTQWIFLELFDCWYDYKLQRAKRIDELIFHLSKNGTENLFAVTSIQDSIKADDWNSMSEPEQQKYLLNFRLAYLSFTPVNWCPALGTVLSNEEVKDGVSERGGHPVIRVPMRQWSLRITAYADRLLAGLDTVDWPEPLKEMQRNWIGKSEGLELAFEVEGFNHGIEIFTTRPDTLFGVCFLSLAPEHPLALEISAIEHKKSVEAYIEKALSRSERDRISDTKELTGVFTGVYAIHPLNGNRIPIWVADYVLAGYGTGAVMGVPAHDDRDFVFAKKNSLNLKIVIEPIKPHDFNKGAWVLKEGLIIDSDFLNGLSVEIGIQKVIQTVEEKGLGQRKINFRFRDAIFSRQRYWGEPIPIMYKDGIPYAVSKSDLPVTLPEVISYKPTGNGDSPLAGIIDWVNLPNGYQRETNTMPGWAGSSWYFLRYPDSSNNHFFCTNANEKYWMNVDFYLGGAEHAVGHLLYARFWTKFLYDLNHITHQEPFQRLFNQGMILGYRYFLEVDIERKIAFNKPGNEIKIPKNNYKKLEVKQEFINDKGFFIKENLNLLLERNNLESLEWKWEDSNTFEVELGLYTDKMSKSLGNVVNPDDMCKTYGADTFRMYEMFLGPLDQPKPWNTNGISGVHSFLKRWWNLMVDESGKLLLTDEIVTNEENRFLHQLIKKVTDDIEKLSFNTTVSAFMIFVNKMNESKCCKRLIMLPAVICLAPFAPHFAEEIWMKAGNTRSVFLEKFPIYDDNFLVSNTFEYPIQINGKTSNLRLSFDINKNKDEIGQEVIKNEGVNLLLKGKRLLKLIVVPGRIINLVIE
jgi:leucyl-tRNA synthetase